ncbi:MAG: hypothetical protein ACI80M_000202 [Gammaproteobacteria bacterium]|jgi:hypothetical protein
MRIVIIRIINGYKGDLLSQTDSSVKFVCF